MKIELTYFLNKKRISLEYFCKLNNLTSYDLLLEYCGKNNFICVDLDQFNAVHKKEEQKKNNESSKNKINAKPTAKTRRRGRKPKTEKSGNANSKSNTQ